MKRKFLKIISSILVVITLLTMFPIASLTTNAAANGTQGYMTSRDMGITWAKSYNFEYTPARNISNTASDGKSYTNRLIRTKGNSFNLHFFAQKGETLDTSNKNQLAFCIEPNGYVPSLLSNGYNGKTNSNAEAWTKLGANKQKLINMIVIASAPISSKSYAYWCAGQLLVHELIAGRRTTNDFAPTKLPSGANKNGVFYGALSGVTGCTTADINNAYLDIVKKVQKCLTPVPSFMKSTDTFALKYNKSNGKYSAEFEDSNNSVIYSEDFSYTGTGVTMSISGKKLTLTSNKPAKGTLIYKNKVLNALQANYNSYIKSNKNGALSIVVCTTPTYKSCQALARGGASLNVTNKQRSYVSESRAQYSLKKSSSNPEITNGNSCYSLEGAVYTIYKDAECKVPAGLKITTDKNGNGTLNNLLLDKNWKTGEAFTYFAKETKAPKGYALDKNVYKFTDSGKKTADGYPIYSFNCKDKPLNDPIVVILKKVDSVTGEATERLAGAEFTVKYYDGFYSSEAEVSEKSPTRTWVFKTDEYGYIELSNTYKVSGDDFYYATDSGNPALPLGTVTVKETKAPTNYKINEELFIGQITAENGGALGWLTTNELTEDGKLIVDETPKNTSATLQIKKISDDHKNDIYVKVTSNAVVKGLTDDTTLKYDSAGKLNMTIQLPKTGVYNFKKLPRLDSNGNAVKYTVTELGFKKSDGTFYIPKRYIDDGKRVQTVTLKENALVTVKFENRLDWGSVELTKDCEDDQVEGITFKITGFGNPVYMTTDPSGFAVLHGLRKYDDNDKVITYTATELGKKQADGSYKLPEQYINPAPQSFTFEDKDAVELDGVKQLYFYNEIKYGTVKVKKTCDCGDNRDIVDVCFHLYDIRYDLEDSDVGYTYEVGYTDENGELVFEDIPVYDENGDKIQYKLIENGDRRPPSDAYGTPVSFLSNMFIAEEKEIELEYEKETEAPFKNHHIRGKLKINKISEDKEVDGIWFEIKPDENCYIYDPVTRKNITDTRIWYVQTKNGGIAVTDDAVDKNGKPLPCGGLDAFSTNGEKRGYYISELGFKQSDGSYALPERYEKVETQHVVIADEAQEDFEVEFYPTVDVSFLNSVKSAPLEIIKSSEDNYDEGITFNVKGSNGIDYGNVTVEIIGDGEEQTAIARYENLPVWWGSDNKKVTYTIKELGILKDGGDPDNEADYEIPFRYLSPRTKKTTLNEPVEDETTGEMKVVPMRVDFYNYLKTGNVTLYKKDYNNNGLSGSKWRLYKSDGTEVITTYAGEQGKYAHSAKASPQELLTNESGDLKVMDLPVGDYYFIETKSPNAGISTYGKKLSFSIKAESKETLNVTLEVKDFPSVIYNTGGSGAGSYRLFAFTSIAISLLLLFAYSKKKKRR